MANVLELGQFVILKMIAEIIVMNQDRTVLYVVCRIMFCFCNNDIYSYKQLHVADLGF